MILSLLIVFIITVFVVAYLCYRLVFYNANKLPQDHYLIPPGSQYEAIADTLRSMVLYLDSLPFEAVNTESFDGLKLAGRFYNFKKGGPVQIHFHGYRGDPIRDYAGNCVMVQDENYNVLLVDQRAHGSSGGHTITFGIKERKDCLAWVQYVNDRFGSDTNILLSGDSMGAATVLMASELALPKNVVGITADCPYSSPKAIIYKVCRDIKLPPRLCYPCVVLGALVYGRTKLWSSSPVEAVRHTSIPILLIHGEDDRFVPCNMSREIQKNCAGPCELITVPKAGHVLSALTDPDTYYQGVYSFYKNCNFI